MRTTGRKAWRYSTRLERCRTAGICKSRIAMATCSNLFSSNRIRSKEHGENFTLPDYGRLILFNSATVQGKARSRVAARTPATDFALTTSAV